MIVVVEDRCGIELLARQYPDDPGALAPLYLNVLLLKPGDALYMDAGLLHAYLRGTGFELMANSDNVLRGGCTGKHVDPPELLRTLRFTDAARGRGRGPGRARR